MLTSATVLALALTATPTACKDVRPGMMSGMPQQIVQLPGIERVDVPVARQSVPPLHAYLRSCILDGRLPPGTKLSQATLADQLGVSRTPMREVLRMLQEEGLVTSEPNQRMRVAGLDPVELDSDYRQLSTTGPADVTPQLLAAIHQPPH